MFKINDYQIKYVKSIKELNSYVFSQMMKTSQSQMWAKNFRMEIIPSSRYKAEIFPKETLILNFLDLKASKGTCDLYHSLVPWKFEIDFSITDKIRNRQSDVKIAIVQLRILTIQSSRMLLFECFCKLLNRFYSGLVDCL